MPDELLDIVDENDNVIDVVTRQQAHEKGLLHREVFVLFVTPCGDIVFQRRSKSKATNPGLLAFTVGGHVESGQTCQNTAIRETSEETGLAIDPVDLIFLSKIRSNTVDRQTRVQNNVFQTIYGCVFKGQISDLRVEVGEGDGFVLIPGNSMLQLPEQEKTWFASDVVGDVYNIVYTKLLALVNGAIHKMA